MLPWFAIAILISAGLYAIYLIRKKFISKSEIPPSEIAPIGAVTDGSAPSKEIAPMQGSSPIVEISGGEAPSDAPESSNKEHAQPMEREYEEIAFIDLETTGLDPEADRVIEVALLVLKLGFSGNVKGYSELAHPGRPIPERITELTGITNDMVSGSSPSGVVVSELLDQIGSRTIAAYNAKFDIAFLKAEAERLGRTFNNDYICVMEYAKSKHPNLIRYRLGDACNAFGILDTSDGHAATAHRAGYDAERAVKLFLAINSGSQPKQSAQSLPTRNLDYSALDKFHEIRNSAKSIAAAAKIYEPHDMENAINGYRRAIELLKKAGAVEIYQTAGSDPTSKTNDLGDINCLNRLTICLCKLNRGSEAAAAAADYFACFPRESELKIAEQIRKRVAKTRAPASP